MAQVCVLLCFGVSYVAQAGLKPKTQQRGVSLSSGSWVLGLPFLPLKVFDLYKLILLYLAEINETKETCVGPCTTSCPGQQQPSGDNGSDGLFSHSRDDRDDQGPRCVLCRTSGRLPKKVPGEEGRHTVMAA